MRVALLVTGRTEWHGLREDDQRGESLRAGAFTRLFPGHEFYVLPDQTEVESYPDGFPCNGFTSNPLTDVHAHTSPPEAAFDLVIRAAQAALGDTRARVRPADLVVILDDLELANVDRPGRVARVFCAAASQHLNSLREPIATRTRDALRERVSFHLLVPMIEALFFAEPAALGRAGVPAERSAIFDPACDPERFQTADAAYLSEQEAICHCLLNLNLPQNRRRKLQPKWFDTASRAIHPKGYLQWLCRDGAKRNCTSYHETKGGARALAGLHWSSLLDRPLDHFQYLRALLADLAEGLGQDPETGPVLGTQAPITSRATRRTSPVLRNL